jgi:hypothetical protein
MMMVGAINMVAVGYCICGVTVPSEISLFYTV